MKLNYNRNLKKLASELRKNSTLAEVILWNELKNKKLMGYDFHRQKPIGKYIVDFFSAILKLIIETDGVTHNFNLVKDQQRQYELEQMGLHILRFQDSEVKNNLEGVLEWIKLWIFENNGKS